jgi:hypothetical protein
MIGMTLHRDPQAQPGPVRDAVGAKLTAEGDPRACEVVREDRLDQDRPAGRFGDRRHENRGGILGQRGVIIGTVELPAGQPAGEIQVARLEPRPTPWKSGPRYL